MSYEKPVECALCGEGLFEKGPQGNPQRIGETELVVTSDENVAKMEIPPKKRGEVTRAFALKIGLCPDCIDDYDLQGSGELADTYDDIVLHRAKILPKKEPP
ncbi:uncharacterized protein NP_0298A [Natronomonas pharaonis DSM 2160]|uniref:Uncharacterized protein n=1 Tax=Natronomonas pharaonis (strain ATCC 35678 / DSM 2160 / CIP 103997 / JCM 8858 / NBRC 14720 / NCIMB 2260 / Gabara) TaxID=348780 RepID=A0A1U7ETJ9_NATPD|nr:hypothetical protein [Natronomonas pharaonis]CAI48240.1 uncharacterized protein NP_0298A [Natronomonas pharaonis DSM 2160]